MASEQHGRFYSPETLAPLYEVPSADGKKMIKVTLAHARKLRLLPSVTSILEIMSSYQLEQWKIEQAIKTCIRFPFDREQSEPEVQSYIEMIQAKAGEYASSAADIGKELHKDVEVGIVTGKEPENPVSQKILASISKFLVDQGATKTECEKGFGSLILGYAGTPDIWADCGSYEIIIDLKTTSLQNFRSPYFKWKLQLGAYRKAIAPNAHIWQCVADRASGEVRWIEHDNADATAEAFLHLFELWIAERGYDPRSA